MSGFNTSRWTRSDLEDEVENLRSKLEVAHSVISDALGYGDIDDEDEDEDEEYDEGDD